MFGVVTAELGRQVPAQVCFWLDNTASVIDERGNPMHRLRGCAKECAAGPPDGLHGRRRPAELAKLASHQEVVDALAEAWGIAWADLPYVGTPQLRRE